MEYVKEINKDEIIYEQVKPINKLPFDIKKIQLTGNEENNKIPAHWHRSVEIIIPIIGEVSIWIDGRYYNVKPYHFFIINSKDIHFCENTYNQKPYLGYAIQIKYEFLFKLDENIRFKENNLINNNEILNILLKLIKLNEVKDVDYELLCMSNMYKLLYYLNKNKISHYHNISNKQNNLISLILNYIDENCDSIVSIESIADTFNVSYGYLAKLFKSINIKPLDYLNYARIKKIEKELLLSNDSIAHIAMLHGFSNTKSFYREFKKYHFITPKQYRKKAKNH